MPSRSKAVKAAYLGLLLALAVVMGYVEYRIPFHLGIPGVKLGLSNIVIVITLYELGALPALLISVLRVGIVALLFGSPVSALYGLAGTGFSLLVMTVLHRTDRFSLIAVSAAGGAAHELGQILTAALLLKSSAVFYYLPVLLIAGELTGALIGFVAALLHRTLKKMEKGKRSERGDQE